MRTDYNAVIYQTNRKIEKRFYLPVLEIQPSSFFSSFFSSSSFAFFFLASMRAIMVRVFPSPMSSAKSKIGATQTGRRSKEKTNNYNLKLLKQHFIINTSHIPYDS